MECRKNTTQKSLNRAIGIFKSEKIPIPMEYVNEITMCNETEKVSSALVLKKRENNGRKF